MSHPILDKLLNNHYPLVNKFLFYGVTAFSVWQARSLLSDAGAIALGFSATAVNYFFSNCISKKFWGEKKTKVIVSIEHDEKISYVLATDITAKGPYPIKSTLTEIECDIREQLALLLRPNDLLGSDGVAVNSRSIEAYTHRISREIIKKNRDLFYLSDQNKVKEPAFQAEIEDLMVEPGEKRKLK